MYTRKIAKNNTGAQQSEHRAANHCSRTSTNQLVTPNTRPADCAAEQQFAAPFNIIVALRTIRHLMSVEEVGDLLGRSKFTVYRMVRNNQIPHLVISGSLRFDPSVLELWLVKKDPALAVAARQLTAAA